MFFEDVCHEMLTRSLRRFVLGLSEAPGIRWSLGSYGECNRL
jgi:hypothetical protein